MIATATDPVEQLYAEQYLTQPLVVPIPIRPDRHHNWVKWALIAGLVVAGAITAEMWRIHSRNAVRYETVAAERGPLQASVTATGTVNAVVDVQVGSQVSGNIKALYADFNTEVTKGPAFVGGIGIMNIMLISVRERTREIGLRQALGAKTHDILNQFLVEAVTLSIAGGVVGVVFGITASAVISRLAGWATSVGFGAVLLAVFFSALVGVSFGYYPARRAAFLDPIEALRSE